jgi:low affinity Fe/Cu permease
MNNEEQVAMGDGYGPQATMKPSALAMNDLFRKFARIAADVVGSPWAFLAGVVITIAWACTGWIFRYSDTWQLVINTGTSVVTFLVVFLIQSTQNREAKVMQLKLDELIRAVRSARTQLVQMEELSDADLDSLKQEFEAHRCRAVGELERIERQRQSRAAD